MLISWIIVLFKNFFFWSSTKANSAKSVELSGVEHPGRYMKFLFVQKKTLKEIISYATDIEWQVLIILSCDEVVK